MALKSWPVFFLLSGCAFAQTPYMEAEYRGKMVIPEFRAAPDLLSRLQVPEGFKVQVFASQLGQPRLMVRVPAGILVSRPDQKSVLLLEDKDGDGAAESRTEVIAGIDQVHGLAVRGTDLYLTDVQNLYRARMTGAPPWRPEKILSLPDGGQHPRRSLGIGPDDKLYISIGSTCNACEEPNRWHAAMIRAELDGSQPTVFAEGLRNTIGFDWHPVSREMWGADMQSDWRGDDVPEEEINRIASGAHYGWPYCYGTKVPDRWTNRQPKGKTKESFCAASAGAILALPAHSSPISFVFYTGANFPATYRNDAFATLRGSWNKANPDGYKVVRIRFRDGKPVSHENFLSGFLDRSGKVQYGRISGLVVANDGALLVSDDEGGTIYRVSQK